MLAPRVIRHFGFKRVLAVTIAGGLVLWDAKAADLKGASRAETLIYLAVMSVAGPSVLFNNATRSFRSRDCSTAAYVFAVTVAGYWSFTLGLMILAFYMKL